MPEEVERCAEFVRNSGLNLLVLQQSGWSRPRSPQSTKRVVRALTVARVRERLGVEAMSLYRYRPSRELHA